MGRTNRTTWLALILAVIGGGAAYIALQPGDAGASAEARETVVVAARDLAVGTRLEAAHLRETEVMGNAVPEGAIQGIAEALDRYVTLPMVHGETLLVAKTSTQPPGSGLAVLIPAGQVAVSVGVNDVIRAGGFIAPGDRVDVLGVVSREATATAEVILRDITVLAVSSNVIGEGGGGSDARASNPRSIDTTVTLAVTVEQAQRLVQVDEIGTLRLALRARAGE